VQAGLGAVGRNNLVITPEYGLHVRWRVLLLDHAAEATGPVHYDPCDECDVPYRGACTVGAFDETA
jgi:epoxyqueuosine reductase